MRPDYRAAHAVGSGLFRLLFGLEVHGAYRVPQDGGVVVTPNHISFWDPPLIAASVPREAYHLAKEELFHVPGLSALIRWVNAIPIRRGVTDLTGISRALEVLRNGKALVIFPEGGRMKDGELHAGRPGVGFIVAHARVPVVPVYVTGTNHIRRCLWRGERARIHFGVPVPAEALLAGADAETGRATYQLVADRVMEAIARLKRECEGAESSAAPGPTERGAIS
jgi:1-acyl-sn-glycerol-3-phosphate acyltransferase